MDKLQNLVSYKNGPSVVITEDILSKINNLKKNGPNKILTNDDIYVRSMIVIGEEPTSKMSIHPEGTLNGKTVRILSQLSKSLPGVSMLEGHKFDTIGWGRIFDSAILSNVKGYTGNVVKLWYYFLKNEKGKVISDEIDSGIRAEGSISYTFDQPLCSICHNVIGYSYFSNQKRCKEHQLGKKYTINGEEQVCYWYPSKITNVLEVSHVFAGAYGKTKSDYSDAPDSLKNGLAMLDKIISEHSVSNNESLDIVKDLNQGENLDDDIEKNPEKLNQENEDANNGTNEETNKETNNDSTNEETNKNTDTDSNSNSNPGTDTGTNGSDKSGNIETNNNEPETGLNECCNNLESHNIDTDESLTKLSVCLTCDFTSEYQSEKECPNCKTITEIGYVDSDLYQTHSFSSSMAEKINAIKTDYQNNEYYEKECLKELPTGSYSIEPLYNGVWFNLIRNGSLLQFKTENENYTKDFPEIISEAKNIKLNSFSIVGELVVYINGKRLEKNKIQSLLISKEKPENSKFIFKAFDIVSTDKNLKDISALQRYLVLDETIKDLSFIQSVFRKVVEHEVNSDSISNAIDSIKTSEGVLIKNLEHKYNKDDEKFIYKYTENQNINLLIDSIENIDDYFVYSCSYKENDKIVVIGETLPTKIKASVGDVVLVKVDYVLKNDSYFLCCPEVVSLSDKKNSDPVSVLERIYKKNDSKEVITLEHVLNILEKENYKEDVYITGDLVIKKYSTLNIDIYSCNDNDKETILNSFGDKSNCVHFLEKLNDDAEKIKVSTSEEYLKLPYKGKFIIHEHTINNKVHYDLRFGDEVENKIITFTLFEPFPKDSKKIKSYKKSGDIELMKIDGAKDGKNESYKIIDFGKIEIIRNTNNFTDFVLSNSKNNGRYHFLKSTVNTYSLNSDETKKEKLAFLWKAKNQEYDSKKIFNGSVPKIKYSNINGGFIVDIIE